jgi:predicted branched-subunit amino acid permease
VPAWWIPSFWLAVLGSLTAGFATFIYSRKRSPRLGLYLSAVFFAGAAYLIVFALWAGTPRWMGVGLIVALLPGIPWASRLG